MVETRNCQNCKKDFAIDADDFSFYHKIKVPPPTFCPSCRMQRRFMFRNERVLYKRECGLCGKNTISIFSPEKPYTIYCMKCWYSDDWDMDAYGIEYDPSKNFFEQFGELQKKVPYPALIADYTTLVNSDYVNHCGSMKNAYLTFDCDFCEDVLYSTTTYHGKDSMDLFATTAMTLCYEVADADHSSHVFFSRSIVEGVDVYFSRDCTGCTNCFGCINLRNKSYHVFNKPVTKQEFQSVLESYDLSTHSGVERAKKETEEFFMRFPRRFMYGFKSQNVSGDYIYYSKNAKNSFMAQCMEDCAYCQFMNVAPIRDCYDYTEWGDNAELIYEGITVGRHVSNIHFCSGVYNNSRDIEYSRYVLGSHNMFGCVGQRNKQYRILNKQYTKEEYVPLREKIIADMNANPYRDAKGRVWKYGEFFPYDFSIFDYNESFAAQYFPLTKEVAIEKGFTWQDAPRSSYEVTVKVEDLPESIHDVKDTILKEIIECESCSRAYRIVEAELGFLRRFSFPVPHKCPDCRHFDRLAKFNKPSFYERSCNKCGTQIVTSYAPDRPEIVYCESCYQKEVI